MKSQDYSKLSKPQIKEKIAELTERIMKSYGFTSSKEKPENRKPLKKQIAKLKTELNSRVKL